MWGLGLGVLVKKGGEENFGWMGALRCICILPSMFL